MKSYDLDSIVKLNKDFYESNASGFSVTRQTAWPGWLQILPFVKQNDHILDLGCGNGRFYQFLTTHLKFNFTYTGIDNSEGLIDIAKKLNPNRFEIADIIADLYKLQTKYDLIVSFGVLHHIPTFSLRRKWINDVSNHLKPNGYFILTLWTQEPNKGQIVQSNLIEKGDYILNWNKNDKLKRFVHVFDQQEVASLVNQSIYETVKTFRADGKNRNSNIYLVLKKR